jgi:hypothetical protein
MVVGGIDWGAPSPLALMIAAGRKCAVRRSYCLYDSQYRLFIMERSDITYFGPFSKQQVVRPAAPPVSSLSIYLSIILA